MSLTEDQITAQNFKDFFNIIKPYLNNTTNMGFTPVGTIISVMGKTAPNNYLSCEGQIVNISDYPELANYFTRQFEQVNYFGGDGISTFGVPDLRGEFLRGAGTNSHTNGGSGADVGVHQHPTITDLPIAYADKTIGILSSNTGKDFYDSSQINLDSISASSGDMLVVSGWKATNYANFASYTSRPTNTSVLYCIATKNIYVDAKYDYSFDEKVIGTWVDGKPIYQKTISFSKAFSSYSSARYCSYETDIENVDCLIDHNGYFLLNNSSGVQKKVIGDSDMDWNIKPGFSSQVYINSDSNKPIIACVYQSPNYNSTNFEGVVTLQYTKTTD